MIWSCKQIELCFPARKPNKWAIGWGCFAPISQTKGVWNWRLTFTFSRQCSREWICLDLFFGWLGIYTIAVSFMKLVVSAGFLGVRLARGPKTKEDKEPLGSEIFHPNGWIERWKLTRGYCWWLKSWTTTWDVSGQFITTSAEVTPNGGLVRESPPKIALN